MILYWQHRVVLGHHQRPKVKDRQSVNILLLSAEDGVWLLWNYSEAKKWVLMISIRYMPFMYTTNTYKSIHSQSENAYELYTEKRGYQEDPILNSILIQSWSKLDEG